MKDLDGHQPTTELINDYLTKSYATNKSTRNRVGREIVHFCNRYLTLKGKPKVVLVKAFGVRRKANLAMPTAMKLTL